MNRFLFQKYFYKNIHIPFFDNFFYKNKESKLSVEDCVIVLNDFLYRYGGSI